MDPNLYLGLPGNLRQLYWPSGGVSAPRIRDTALFRTGTGGARVSKLLGAVRTYSLDYAGLGYDNFAFLEALDQGHMGPGPFVLLDPGRRNMLTANQSSSCSLTNDTRDFTVSGTGGSLSKDSTTITWGPPNTLKWTFSTVTPGTSSLSLTKPSASWYGWPVAPRPYTFWFWARGGGTDGVIQLQPTLQWYTTSGASAGSSTIGALVNTSATVPGLFSVTGTPPYGAAYVSPIIFASSATIAAGDAIYMWSFMLNEGSQPDATWKPGTGMLPVQVMSQVDVQPNSTPDFRKGNQLILQEVR